MKKYVYPALVLVFTMGFHTNAAETTEQKSGVRQELQEFKSTMNTKLEKMDKDIQELEAKASNKKTETKENWNTKLAELKILKGEIAQELQKAADTTKEQFTKFKAEVNEKYEKLSTKTKEATKKITD